MPDTVKHTEGPWLVRRHWYDATRLEVYPDRNVDVGDPSQIADVFSHYAEEVEDQISEAKANAYLISAAPDFLSSAKKLISAFDYLRSTTSAERILTGRSDKDIRRESDEAIEGLRSAIAKAEGRS